MIDNVGFIQIRAAGLFSNPTGDFTVEAGASVVTIAPDTSFPYGGILSNVSLGHGFKPTNLRLADPAGPHLRLSSAN